MNLKPLPWDSTFFNLKIGKICDTDINPDFCELDIKYYDLIYIEKLKIKKLNKELSKIINPSYIDKKDIYIKTIGFESEKDPKVKPYQLNTPNSALIKLAIQSAAFSRFKLDKNFKNDLYKKLYSIWIKNSVEKKSADIVLIYGTIQNPLGFITVVLKNETAYIGLLAVSESHQNKGIGKALIEAAGNFALKNNLFKLHVITQSENTNACAFYKKNGFKKDSVIYTYHHWNKKC